MKNRLFVLWLFTLWACKREVKLLPPCDTLRMYYDCEPNTRDYILPFWSHKTYVYKDTLGNEMTFKSNYPNGSNVENITYNCSGLCDGELCKAWILYPEKTLFSVNDTSYYIIAETYINLEPDKCDFCGIENLNFRISNFQKTTAIPVSVKEKSNKNAQKTETVILANKKYEDVLIDKNSTLPSVYWDKKVGVRAFRNENNHLWIFDRFE